MSDAVSVFVTGAERASAERLTVSVRSEASVLPLIRSDWSQIQTFLDEHTHVREILPEGIARLTRHFGHLASGIALEIYEDPDGGKDTQLFVIAMTRATCDGAQAALERFDEEWWLDAQDQARGDLGFALEYV